VKVAYLRAIGENGTIDFVPILMEIAQSDPFVEPLGPNRFPVRQAATEAIRSIQARTKTQ
jgi:hypothetical protein